jgi:hypothetical protein
MITLKKRCNYDPAVAIQAIIDGLLRHESIKKFQLDFDYRGKWKDDCCFGGAETIVLIELLEMSFAPKQLDDDLDRAGLMSTDRLDLLEFEYAIDCFSIGNSRAIEQYFGLPISDGDESLWNLQNDNWKNELPKIIHFWEELTGQKYEYLGTSLNQRWKGAVSASKNPLVAVIKERSGEAIRSAHYVS